jgi:hypothetical protein
MRRYSPHPPNRAVPALPARNGYLVRAIRPLTSLDAPATSAEPTYPVLVFSPGLGATPMDDPTRTQRASSLGVNAAAAVPTYGATFIVVSDGRATVGHDIIPRRSGIGAA